MGSVFPFNVRKVLTLQEAKEILPVIRKITDDAKTKVSKIVPVIEALPEQDNKKKQLESEVSTIVEQWQKKVEKLGGEPKGLWLVDFDCGVGYFCWKFPETEIGFFHGYTEGFKSRIKISSDFENAYNKKPSSEEADTGLKLPTESPAS